MTLAELQRVFELARVAFQVQLPGDNTYLIDPDSFAVDVTPPGGQDARDEHADTWRILLGEEGDGGLAKGEGATLDEAAEELRAIVEARAATVRALLGGGP